VIRKRSGLVVGPAEKQNPAGRRRGPATGGVVMKSDECGHKTRVLAGVSDGRPPRRPVEGLVFRRFHPPGQNRGRLWRGRMLSQGDPPRAQKTRAAEIFSRVPDADRNPWGRGVSLNATS